MRTTPVGTAAMRAVVACLAVVVLYGCSEQPVNTMPALVEANNSAESGNNGLSDSDDSTLIKSEKEPSKRPENKLCHAGSRSTAYGLTPVFGSLQFSRPVVMAEVPGSTGNSFFIMQKDGLVKAVTRSGDLDIDNGFVSSTLLQLDVASAEESGSTGIAFHPAFAANGRVFFAYGAVGENTDFELRISEFQASGDNAKLMNERRVLTVPKNNPIHYAGALSFGPDGYLYISIGDDGNNQQFDDQRMAAQDPANFYGTILRIDIDSNSDQPFVVPVNNPDYGTGIPSPVFAYGFRNPWTLSFDRENKGDLWASDVGWFKVEEINRIAKGGNHGWPLCEGECDQHTPELLDPYYSYPNTAGAAVIGGYVYRGTEIPDLYGKYVFADYIDRGIKAIDTQSNSGAVPSPTSLVSATFNISSFTQGSDGELYVIGYSNGEVNKLVKSAQAEVSEPPELLSSTGCFAFTRNGDPKPLPGVFAYDTAQSFWSDGASKKRLLALPENTTIDSSDIDAWELPPGAVTIKHFYMNDSIFETRFLVRHDEGSYGGYTYQWDEDLDDATLVPAEGRSVTLGEHQWDYPSRADCMRCHTAQAGYSLSLESRQLSVKSRSNSKVSAQQLDFFESLDIINSAEQALATPFPQRAELTDQNISLDRRARSYLHVNCASCHQGEGTAGRANWNARFTVSIEDMRLCGEAPFEPVSVTVDADERLLVPGAPGKSTLWLRAMDRGSSVSMPPLASHLIDTIGVELLNEWITAMDSDCEISK